MTLGVEFPIEVRGFLVEVLVMSILPQKTLVLAKQLIERLASVGALRSRRTLRQRCWTPGAPQRSLMLPALGEFWWAWLGSERPLLV